MYRKEEKLRQVTPQGFYGLSRASQLKLVYQLIKGQDKETLKMIKNLNSNSHDIFNEAVILLAKEGDHESVKFLISKFNASKDAAVNGYAQGGYFNEVNKLVGTVLRIRRLIDNFILTDEKGDDRWTSIRKHAVDGYKKGGYLTEDNILHLLSVTTSKSLGNYLVAEAKKDYPSIDKKSLLNQSDKIRQVMSETELNFTQAQAYINTPTKHKFWLSQGLQLVTHKDINGNPTHNKLPHLPPELYQHITSFVTGEDVRVLTIAVNLGLRQNIAFNTKGFPFFRKKESLIQLQTPPELPLFNKEELDNARNMKKEEIYQLEEVEKTNSYLRQ